MKFTIIYIITINIKRYVEESATALRHPLANKTETNYAVKHTRYPAIRNGRHDKHINPALGSQRP